MTPSTLADTLARVAEQLALAQAELTSIRILGPWERQPGEGDRGNDRWFRRNLRAPNVLGVHFDYCDERMVHAYGLPETGWWTWHYCPGDRPRRFASAIEAMTWLDEQATADGVVLADTQPGRG